MKKTISKYFLQILIVILLIVLIFKGCKDSKSNNSPQNYSDTIRYVFYEYHDSTIISKPQIIQTYRNVKLDSSIRYVPSGNYDSLVQQFSELKNELLAFNVYKDSIKVDSLGSALITDTIHRNTILGRSVKYNLKVPIKETVINNYIYPNPKGQVYLGGGIYGNDINPVKGVDLGILYKNKKDFIFGAKVGMDIKGQWNAGISSFWKIKL